MELSTKVKYGLKAMLELGFQYGKGPISATILSKNQDIPERYLNNLLTMLKRSSLIISIRGSQGGYILYYPPEQITIEDIFISLEGPIKISNCISSINEPDCVMENFWKGMEETISKYLKNKTLADLVKEAEEKLCEKNRVN